MSYILDTDVIINHLRGKKLIDLQILERGASISIITLGELFFGAYKSDNPEKTLAKTREQLENLRLEITNLDEVVMDKFGQLKANLEKEGRRLEDFDLLIAATAKANSLKLLTKNIKHFQRIPGLEVA